MDTKNKTIAILASWNLTRVKDEFYIPSTHFNYLTYVAGIYGKVFLLSPITISEKAGNCSYMDFQNVVIIPLPYSRSYISALHNWRAYKDALKEVSDKVDLVYCRVPDPFSWMPSLLFKKKCIIHFVGDTIDATLHNEKWSWLKKQVMIAGYLPDYRLTLLAAKKSRVYTNGPHIAAKLHKNGVNATPVISSTIFEKDLHEGFKSLPIEEGKVIISYVGYIRFAKGCNA